MTSTNNKEVQVKNLISRVFWLRFDRDLMWKYHSGILGLSQPPKKKKKKKKHYFCCFGFKLSWNCCLCLCVGAEISLMCSLFCTLPDCPSTPERSILYNKAFWQTWLERTVRSDKHRWLWVCVCMCACVSLSASLFMAVFFGGMWFCSYVYYYLFVSGGERCSATKHVCSLALFTCITEIEIFFLSSGEGEREKLAGG